MKACDERARQRDEDGTGNPCAVGEAVARASVSAWCLPPSVVQPPCPGKAGSRQSCSGLLAGGCEEEYRNEPCDRVWDLVGLTPPQADVFGPCFSGLSWKTAPSPGSARVSRLYCERSSQVLWKPIHRARVSTGAFVSDNSSETWMIHVTSAKH